MDYQWLPHWKCTVNLAQQIGFARPNGENWLENGQWLTAISSSGYKESPHGFSVENIPTYSCMTHELQTL